MATLTEAAISESRKVFDACDRDGDGFIDSAEFGALLEELDGDMSSAECQLNFEAVDTEGDGYIVGVVDRIAERRSELHVIDTQNFDGEPIAIVRLPMRISGQVHGWWTPASQIPAASSS